MHPILVELLEPRIAPAVLVNPSTVQFTDADGDLVTVKFSKNVLDDQTFAEQVFNFDTAFADMGPQQLQEIDLLQDPRFQGVSIVITAKGGNNQADIGFINAEGLDLGKVAVKGDLGKILIGSAGANAELAVKSLEITSLSRLGATTQAPGGDTDSRIDGSAGKILIAENLFGSLTVEGRVTVKAEIKGAVDGASLPDVDRPAVLLIRDFVQKLDIGGGIAGDAAETGVVRLEGGVIKVTIIGRIAGGDGNSSGRLEISGGPVVSLTVKGDVVGGNGVGSGAVELGADSPVQKEFKIVGGLFGGGGNDSGTITAGGFVAKFQISDAIEGEEGENSGSVHLNGGNKIFKSGDITGGDGQGSGRVFIDGDVAKFTAGDLKGGNLLDESGNVTITGDLGKGKLGDIIGGGAEFSGTLSIAGAVSKLETGDIFGDTGFQSGRVEILGGIGKLQTGVIDGGFADETGVVAIKGIVGSATVKGGIVAGAGEESGRFFADGPFVNTLSIIGPGGGLPAIDGVGGFLIVESGKNAGTVEITGDVNKILHVKGDVVGGKGEGSGTITIGGTANKVVINSGLIGGEGGLSGSLLIDGNLDKGKISGLTGGEGDFSGSVSVGGIAFNVITGPFQGGVGDASGAFYGQDGIGKLSVRGGTQGGAGEFSAAIVSNNGSINAKVSGNIEPGGGAASAAVMAAQTLNLHVTGNAGSFGGSKLFISGGNMNDGPDPAIDKLIVGRDLINARVTGGWTPPTIFDPPEPQPFTGNGNINKIQVGLFITGSDIGAGVTPGAGGGFGDDSSPITGGGGTIGSLTVVRGFFSAPPEGIAAADINNIRVAGKNVPVFDGQNLADFGKGGGSFTVDLV